MRLIPVYTVNLESRCRCVRAVSIQLLCKSQAAVSVFFLFY